MPMPELPARRLVGRMLRALETLTIQLRLRRRDDRRKGVALPSLRTQFHFGSLDDRLLDDLGLQRGDVLAAEYGFVPGDLALHRQGEDEIDSPTSRVKLQPRSAT